MIVENINVLSIHIRVVTYILWCSLISDLILERDWEAYSVVRQVM